ncbi:hypothetical protein EW146_g9902 [Bondarzewia mesenterica]|uniref:ABM domain-containing protein n=1 Tax=Bondarzewia mesenterica TaxID=1095465 RepID=A0A4S4L295_9AGAM|nr:hypothetical protein EW146_g9902 [Bondarzewia mesenterica]
MTPSIEVVNCLASDAYIKDTGIIADAVKIILDVKGVLNVWYGLQIEEPQRTYVVIAWDSIASHHAFEAETDKYERFRALLKPSMAQPPELELYHADLEGDYAAPFNAPVTEFALAAPKAGVTVEALRGLLEKIRPEVNLEDRCPAKASSFGLVTEKPQTFLHAVGWESIESHHDTVKAGPFADLVKEIRAVRDGSFVHAKLTRASK